MRTRTAINPNYDGVQGLVANFKYSLTKDNTWDCNLEVIAEAEVVGNTKVNDVGCDKTVACREDEQGNEKCERDSLLYSFFRSLYNDYDAGRKQYFDTLNELCKADGKMAYIEQYTFNASERSESGQEDADWTEDITPDFVNQPDTTEPFISWATFEAAVNYFCLPQKADASGTSAYVFGRLNSKDIGIAYHESVTSTDPRVCLLPETIAQKSGTAYNIAQKGSTQPATNGWLKYAGYVSTLGISALFESENENASEQQPEGYVGCIGVDEETNKKVIKLDGILLNVVTLMVLLKEVERDGDGSLMTYIKNVLNKVNDACGSLWEFEVVSTAEDDTEEDKKSTNQKLPTLTIIDTKSAYVPTNTEEDPAFYLPATPINSCLRELKFELKMTEGMKTQALYSNGSTKDDKGYVQDAKSTAGGGCGSTPGLEGFRQYNTERIKNKALTVKVDSNKKKCDDAAEVNDTDVPPTFEELIEAVRKDVTDSTVDSLKSALVAKYAESTKAQANSIESHCTGMILPFDFGFTLDGIGGFSFGQMVSSDRIPKQLRDYYYWQVTSVEHSVSPNDWTTTVSTVARVRPKN
jgi:hypothetical protein